MTTTTVPHRVEPPADPAYADLAWLSPVHRDRTELTLRVAAMIAALSSLLLVSANPIRVEQVSEQCSVSRRAGFQVEVRCPASKRGAAAGLDADELQALRNDLTIAGLHFVGEKEEQG